MYSFFIMYFYMHYFCFLQSLSGLQSPHQMHSMSDTGRGMNNLGYIHTEPTPLVSSVGSPPPLTRFTTEPNMASPPPSVVGIPAASTNPFSQQSMILQGTPPSVVAELPSPTMSESTASHVGSSSVSTVSTHVGSSSVSTVSLSGHQLVASSMYPKLQRDIHSTCSEVPHSPPHSSSNCPPDAFQPTDEAQKKAWSALSFSENISIIYALFLICLGLVIYLADIFSDHGMPMTEGFNIFLMSAQLMWLFYVHIDVRRYVNMISRALDEAKLKELKAENQVELEPTADGQYQLRITLPETPRTIPHHYGFTSGDHGGSIYLKIGATCIHKYHLFNL